MSAAEVAICYQMLLVHTLSRLVVYSLQLLNHLLLSYTSTVLNQLVRDRPDVPPISLGVEHY